MSVSVSAVVGLSLAAASLFFILPNIFHGVPSLAELMNVTQPLDNESDVQFVLFTRNNSPRVLKPNGNLTLNDSGFDPENPTKIITHGFLSSIKNPVFQLSKNAYLETGDYNVIGMEWSKLCNTEYALAMRGAKLAGQHLGHFINWLASNGVDLDDVHVIGHSLGAHVAGIGAGRVQGGKVGRITGLDPAGPGYGDMKEELKLDPLDAKMVDVVHTFMRVIGTAKPCGHVDFYPNGGKYQPGCPDITSLTESIFCNHGRSYELFAEAIRNPGSFRSKKCTSMDEALSSACLQDSDVYMGQVETYKKGLYYFKTRARSPYSMEGTIEKKLVVNDN